MPPKGRGRKRPISASNLVEEIRAEVEQSITSETAVLEACRVLTSTSMSVDTIRALPIKAVEMYLSVKFSKDLVDFVSSSCAELRALPESLRIETVARLSGLSIDEVSILWEGCSLVGKASPATDLERLQNCIVGNFPVLLTPPTSTCSVCSRILTSHNKPCDVAVYTFSGKTAGLKFSLRCEYCKINYNYDRYGNKSAGWRLYETSRPLVEATDVCFVGRSLLEFQCALANHSWVSFSGFATAFNETFRLLEGDEGYGEKQCSSAFWNGELEAELRDLGRLDFFGLMTLNGDREKVMQEVDNVRAKSVYSHSVDDCSPECKKRGCGKLWVVDGQWKLMFAHCMMHRKNFIRGLPLLNYPDVCTNSPQSGKAFCSEHLQFLNEKHPEVPTDIHGFLRYCGIEHGNTDDDSEPLSEDVLDKEVLKVDKVLASFRNDASSDVGNSVVEAQGNAGFLDREHGSITALLQDCLEPQPTSCNKETGGKQRLQKWSRGHLFIVRGGGIIDKWSPLFKSESPSQVFIIVLSWLFTILKCINPLNWCKVFVAYDNMCHLDGLKAARNLLPWPSPWDKAWMSINKIIDSLHIRNHKDKSCKEKYDPALLKQELPDGNTMAAEQTFVWLSRYKKILCAMPKVHHLFYLHRMVKRRNNYTVTCYKNGKKPLLPKARNKAATN